MYNGFSEAAAYSFVSGTWISLCFVEKLPYYNNTEGRDCDFRFGNLLFVGSVENKTGNPHWDCPWT